MTDRPQLAEQLDLQRHPEGGWFRETWRSAITIRPDGYGGERSVATAIYFLLCPGEHSAWHVVRSDELWLWHSGGPLTLRLGGSGGEPAEPAETAEAAEPTHAVVITLGGDVAAGQQPQAVIPGGTWQSADPAGNAPALVSCIVAPGFDFADFRMHSA